MYFCTIILYNFVQLLYIIIYYLLCIYYVFIMQLIEFRHIYTMCKQHHNQARKHFYYSKNFFHIFYQAITPFK